jgi:hypothetical protein
MGSAASGYPTGQPCRQRGKDTQITLSGMAPPASRRYRYMYVMHVTGIWD